MKYFAKGKILFAGEYALLKGGTGLAAPTKLGQTLSVTESNRAGYIEWKSISESGDVWFEGSYDLKKNTFQRSSDATIAKVLEHVLAEAMKLTDSNALQKGYEIEAKLQFPKNWGLGSSSTLLSTLSQWLEINPYDLNDATLNGSGYDLACADRENPILYKKEVEKIDIQDVELNWPKEDILFTHLGVKQPTAPVVKKFTQQSIDPQRIEEISNVSIELSKVSSKEGLMELLALKENLVSKLINEPPVQKTRFDDATGVVASLGAWGGDFVMSVGVAKAYFQEKGYQTSISWGELITS